MAFKNRIRLPFYVTRPQYPSERNVFRRADGSTKVQSVIIRKVFEGETDNLPKEIHERLIIALSHDDVTVEGRYYLGGVSLESDYDIDWQRFLDFPLAKAEFKAEATPFNYSNDNCQTCDEATQLSLDDDTVTGPYESLEEGQEYEYNVFANDSICCSPVTAEIVTTNSLYVASATIDALTGIVTITMQATMPSATLANLLTYRVTCPNGSYDDADVFANVSGSEEACEPPSSLVIDSTADTEAEISWGSVAGATEYDWQLFMAADLFNPVQTGSTATNSVSLTGLTPGTEYVFYVLTDCGEGDTSPYSNIPFETTGESVGCGMYEVFIYGGEPGEYSQVTHMSCNGNLANAFVQNQSSTVICSMESAPGVPVQITGADEIQYLGPC